MRIRSWCVGLLTVGAIMLTGAGSTPEEPKQAARSLKPDEALAKLKEGHGRFLAGKAKARSVGPTELAKLAKGQEPFAVILACADSRVPPELLFDQGLGDLFVIRVAGNVTGTSILGSIEYAVDHLHVPLVVVLGHESCGAVKAAIEDVDPDGNLGFLLREVHVGKSWQVEKKNRLPVAIKANTAFHAADITKRSAVLKDFVQQDRLKVVAGVVSLSDGHIEWLAAPEKKASAK
jgi:carbonic anhydrase